MVARRYDGISLGGAGEVNDEGMSVAGIKFKPGRASLSANSI